MEPRSPTKIAVIGSGLMGSALARAFAAAGHDVAVWNRTPSKARAVGGGTLAFESLIEAVSGRGLVVVSVSNYAACAELLSSEGVARALAGKTLVQLTSGSPADAREGLEWARAHDVNYLDAAILAYPGFVATDYATVFYAGSRAVFDRHLPTLQAIARNSVYVDEKIGSAATLDCAILEAYYGSSLAFLHAGLCQTYLPHMRPKENHAVWRREAGRFTLTSRPASHELIGVVHQSTAQGAAIHDRRR